MIEQHLLFRLVRFARGFLRAQQAIGIDQRGKVRLVLVLRLGGDILVAHGVEVLVVVILRADAGKAQQHGGRRAVGFVLLHRDDLALHQRLALKRQLLRIDHQHGFFLLGTRGEAGEAAIGRAQFLFLALVVGPGVQHRAPLGELVVVVVEGRLKCHIVTLCTRDGRYGLGVYS